MCEIEKPYIFLCGQQNNSVWMWDTVSNKGHFSDKNKKLEKNKKIQGP